MRASAMKSQLHLTRADHGRRISLEEFLSAGHQEGYRYELIEGRVEVSPVPNLPHEMLVFWLRNVLMRYARHQPDVINIVLGPARIFLPEARWRALPSTASPSCSQSSMQRLRNGVDFC